MKNVDFCHATLLLLHFGLKGFTNTLDSIFFSISPSSIVTSFCISNFLFNLSVVRKEKIHIG